MKHNDSQYVHFRCFGLKKKATKKNRPTDPFFSRHVTVNTPFLCVPYQSGAEPASVIKFLTPYSYNILPCFTDITGEVIFTFSNNFLIQFLQLL